MISSDLSIPLVLATPLALLIILGKKNLLAPEIARKLLHICIGLSATTYPWIFTNPEQDWF